MNQKLKIAIQMDPLEKLDLKGDTTFILGLEAINRNFEVFFILLLISYIRKILFMQM